MKFVINGKEVAGPPGACAYKYSDPFERARWIYTANEALDVEREAPGLVVYPKPQGLKAVTDEEWVDDEAGRKFLEATLGDVARSGDSRGTTTTKGAIPMPDPVNAPYSAAQAARDREALAARLAEVEAEGDECEEALRSTEAEFTAFRERVLAPIKARNASVESLSWDDLLGLAVRNLNQALDLEAALERIDTSGAVGPLAHEIAAAALRAARGGKGEFAVDDDPVIEWHELGEADDDATRGGNG